MIEETKQVFNNIECESLQITSNSSTYRVGENAEITIKSPFVPCDGLATVQCNGIVKTIGFHMDLPTAVVSIPILAEYVPNIFIRVDVVGSDLRLNTKSQRDEKAPKRPAYATGQITLKVPPVISYFLHMSYSHLY